MPDKLAQTDYPIHDLLRDRWSPRSYADRDVEPEKLFALLEAARWAPSCFNEQPWRFIVGTRNEPETYDKLLGILMEGNRSWAGAAPVLMLAVAKLTFTHNDSPNRHAMHDVGEALACLSLQATDLGLSLHQMAGFSVEGAREAFDIPDDYEPATAVVLGYRGELDDLPDELRKREEAPRTRRPLSETVFGAVWGESLKPLK